MVFRTMCAMGQEDEQTKTADGLFLLRNEDDPLPPGNNSNERTASSSGNEADGATFVHSENTCSSDEPNGSVKLDSFYLIQRFFEEVRGGATKRLARSSAVRLGMSLFEENPEDRDEVQGMARCGGATESEAKRFQGPRTDAVYAD